MTEFLEQAKRLEDFMVSSRRYLHQHAELGCDLPKTASFVKEKLKEIGLEPKEICQSGILAEIKGARPGKTILLRAVWMPFPWRRKAAFPFIRGPMRPIPAVMTCTRPCFWARQKFFMITVIPCAGQ